MKIKMADPKNTGSCKGKNFHVDRLAVSLQIGVSDIFGKINLIH
jgi:hypothetical protein